MASKDLYAKGEIPPEVERLLEEFHKKQRQIDQLRGYNDTSTQREMASATRSRAKFEETNAEILALEADKQEIWQQMRRLDAVLAGQIKASTPNIAALQGLIHDDKTALLSFYTTASDTHIFVLRKNQVKCHTCAGQGATLQLWIIDNWLKPYLSNNEEWKKNISRFLGELASRLQLNDLIASHLKGIEELIFVPHLYLHLIPFAAMPVGDPPQPPLKKGGQTEYLGDKFLIRYVPSCQVLEFCHNRPPAERSVASSEYGIIENATEDLPCASFEGEQIATLYQVPHQRRKAGAAQCNCRGISPARETSAGDCLQPPRPIPPGQSPRIRPRFGRWFYHLGRTPHRRVAGSGFARCLSFLLRNGNRVDRRFDG
jgi:CHAT domain-containing protein